MMSGANYHISYLQILESERRLKVSNILHMFPSLTVSSTSTLKEFIQSFSPMNSEGTDIEFYSHPFFSVISDSDLSTIECSTQELHL